jgi:hypothetical protein
VSTLTSERPVRVEVDLDDLEAVRDGLGEALTDVLDAANTRTDEHERDLLLFAALRAIRSAQENVESAISREVTP